MNKKFLKSYCLRILRDRKPKFIHLYTSTKVNADRKAINNFWFDIDQTYIFSLNERPVT